jgi:uncharacterized protein (TIGR02996 family)
VNGLRPFLRAIDAAPDPDTLFVRLGVLADWLDDQCDPAGAECLRWCVAHGRLPHHSEHGYWYFVMFETTMDEPLPAEVKACYSPGGDCPDNPDSDLFMRTSSRSRTYERLIGLWRVAYAPEEATR